MQNKSKISLSILIYVLGLASISPAYSAELLWNDEFNSGALDSALWQYENLGEKFQGFNTEEAVSLVDGMLTIVTQRKNRRIESGMISTKGQASVKSGYLEVRIKQPEVTEGLKCMVQLKSPFFGNSKIDLNVTPEKTGSIVAVLDYNSKHDGFANSVVNWGDWGKNARRNRQQSPVALDDDNFHTFGLELLADEYRFYMDGSLYWSTKEGISGVDMYAVIGCEIKSALGEYPVDNPATALSVDYIRYFDSMPDPLIGQPVEIVAKNELELSERDVITSSVQGNTPSAAVPELLTDQPGETVANNEWDVSERDIISFGAHRDDPSFTPSQPDDYDAIRITLQEGSHRGAGPEVRLPDGMTEAWVSYCMRFSSDWDASVGGKLPGFAAKGSRFSGGYGGKPSNGKNGWSARMLYGPIDEETDSIPVGQYIYHNDPEYDSKYGDPDWWSLTEDRLKKDSVRLKKMQWYEITQHLKLNETDKFDGEIEAWVDSELVYRRSHMNFTNSNKYRNIYRFWLNVYHGGSEVAEKSHSVYFDQVVFSDARTEANCVN